MCDLRLGDRRLHEGLHIAQRRLGGLDIVGRRAAVHAHLADDGAQALLKARVDELESALEVDCAKVNGGRASVLERAAHDRARNLRRNRRVGPGALGGIGVAL